MLARVTLNYSILKGVQNRAIDLVDGINESEL